MPVVLLQCGEALTDESTLHMREPLTLQMEQEGEFYIAKCDELNEFGYGTDPIAAVQDIRNTIAELYWTLKVDQERLGSDLSKTWQRLSELGPVHTIGLNMISLEDGTYRSSIRTNSSLSAGATRQREHVEPPSPQRNSVRRRAWLQVAGLASEVWLLAHSLYPHEPLVQKRSPQSGVRTPSTRADSAHQYRGGFGGQHDCQGASRWHGRVKKNGPQSIGKSRGGWTTKIHMVAADARTALMFSLSAGQAHDAPEGRKLKKTLNRLGPQRENLSIVMDRAYEGNETRQLALALGFTPVVPPSSTRVSPWTYDMEMYKRRNEVERLFRRLKGFRRIFSRFEKLDVLFLGFILLTLIVDALR